MGFILDCDSRISCYPCRKDMAVGRESVVKRSRRQTAHTAFVLRKQRANRTRIDSLISGLLQYTSIRKTPPSFFVIIIIIIIIIELYIFLWSLPYFSPLLQPSPKVPMPLQPSLKVPLLPIYSRDLVFFYFPCRLDLCMSLLGSFLLSSLSGLAICGLVFFALFKKNTYE